MIADRGCGWEVRLEAAEVLHDLPAGRSSVFGLHQAVCKCVWDQHSHEVENVSRGTYVAERSWVAAVLHDTKDVAVRGPETCRASM